MDLPDETFLPAAAVAYVGGSFLQGRGNGIEEKLDEEYRSLILHEAGEYQIEFY